MAVLLLGSALATALPVGAQEEDTLRQITHCTPTSPVNSHPQVWVKTEWHQVGRRPIIWGSEAMVDRSYQSGWYAMRNFMKSLGSINKDLGEVKNRQYIGTMYGFIPDQNGTPQPQVTIDVYHAASDPKPWTARRRENGCRLDFKAENFGRCWRIPELLAPMPVGSVNVFCF